VNNTVEFYASGFTGSDPRPGSGIVLNDTNFHHIAYKYDGVTWAGFLDGQPVFSVARTFSLAASTGKLYLGAFRPDGHYFAGSLVGDVINNGTINVAGSNAVGILTITGNYTQTATGSLLLEIAGSSASNPVQYDQLKVSGSATLAGSISVTLLNGFVPSLAN